MLVQNHTVQALSVSLSELALLPSRVQGVFGRLQCLWSKEKHLTLEGGREVPQVRFQGLMAVGPENCQAGGPTGLNYSLGPWASQVSSSVKCTFLQ